MNFIEQYFDAYFIQKQAGVAYLVFQVFACVCIELLFFFDFILKEHKQLKINHVVLSILKGFGLFITFYGVSLFLSASFLQLIIHNNLSFYSLNYFTYAPIILVCIFLSRKNILERLVRGFTLFNAFTLITTLSRFISWICSSEVFGFLFEFFDTFFMFLFLFAVLSFLFVLNTEKFEHQNYVSVILVCIIQTLVMLTGLLNDPSFSTTEELKQKHVVLFSGLYCTTLFIYLFHYAKHVSQEKALTAQKLAFAQRNQNEIIELSLENDHQIKMMEEGMNNQYKKMAELLQNGDYDKLKEYFSDLTELSFVPLTFVDCGNNAISCIMNIEIAKANKANVKIHHTIVVPKEDIGIDEYDLCSFFTNLIDNAIEGTCRNKVNTSKDIFIRINYEKPYLVSTIINPTDLNKDDLMKKISVTSKDDVKMHGYGKKIIDSIARKYGDSVINYSIKDGKFIVSSMLLGGNK